MAKAPTPGTTGKTSDGVRVGYNDAAWDLRMSEVTPRDVADLRSAVGHTPKSLIASVSQGDVDLDIAAGLIFLARRQSQNRRITFDDATVGLTYESDVTMETLDDDGGDAGPEA